MTAHDQSRYDVPDFRVINEPNHSVPMDSSAGASRVWPLGVSESTRTGRIWDKWDVTAPGDNPLFSAICVIVSLPKADST